MRIDYLPEKSTLTRDEQMLEELNPKNLSDLCHAINSGLLNKHKLKHMDFPTFGGKSPHNCEAVVSWDEDNLLLVHGSTATIVRRVY